MKNIITFLAFFIHTFHIFGQNYKYVTVDVLNIRENSGKEYNIVGKVKKGEKVIAIKEAIGWTQIESASGLKGYVSTKFLTTDITKIKSTIKETEVIGFEYGFLMAFEKCFFITFLIIALIKSRNKVKDGRFKSGFKEFPVTTFEALGFLFYAILICSIIGLFMGSYYWIKSF
jgi:uncharacterized protein YgiM (DUF1202 family)